MVPQAMTVSFLNTKIIKKIIISLYYFRLEPAIFSLKYLHPDLKSVDKFLNDTMMCNV